MAYERQSRNPTYRRRKFVNQRPINHQAMSSTFLASPTNKNGMGTEDRLRKYNFAMVALVAAMAVPMGLLYWGWGPREAGAKKNPGDWQNWKREFRRSFIRIWGKGPGRYGFHNEDYGPYFEKGLSPYEAVIKFSEDQDVLKRKPLGIIERLQQNPSDYYVKTSRVKGLSGWVRGPYTLKSAQDYARIGSQFGRDRSVLRGKGGPVVRKYSGGKRAWPK